MEHRKIGGTTLEVSVIGLGCNNFGLRIDDARAAEVMAAALDAGVTFFDTADIYGHTRSEEILGWALGARRLDVVIATKFGKAPDGSNLPGGGGRAYVMAAAEASLKRLGADYIDLLQMHAPDPMTPVEETLRALDDLVQQGKVRFVGNSNFSSLQIADADDAARGATRFISVQDEYSLLEQGAAKSILPACERYGLSFLPFYPLAMGMLSGKYRRGEAAAAGTRLALNPSAGQRSLTEARFDKIDALRTWAEQRGRSLLDLAFAWLLGHAAIPSVIAGASRAEQVFANVAAADWRLTPTEVAEVGALAQD